MNPELARLRSGGRKAVYEAGSDKFRYYAAGSIFPCDSGSSNFEIWGTGLIYHANTIKSKPGKIHAVRGPLTRERLLANNIECPEVYGDPALLFPRFYDKNVNIQYQVGIIPHYIDRNNPWVAFQSRKKWVKIIDILSEAYDLIDQVRSCELIISSSLHGLIAADAYGIPAIWIELSNRVIGDGFKFRDYYGSIGIDAINPVKIVSGNTPINNIINNFKEHEVNIDLEALYESCPFKEKIYAKDQDKSQNLNQAVSNIKSAQSENLVYGLHSSEYWDQIYVKGGNSGPGSRGKFIEFKAEIINNIIQKHHIRSVVDWGVGDGYLLSKLNIESYVGVDASETAIRQARKKWANDREKTFLHTSELPLPKRYALSMSNDVFYHLIEYATYETYMRNLVESAGRYLLVFSSNASADQTSYTDDAEKKKNDFLRGIKWQPHVFHRHFTAWLEQHAPEFELIEYILNRYPATTTCFPDFYLFRCNREQIKHQTTLGIPVSFSSDTESEQSGYSSRPYATYKIHSRDKFRDQAVAHYADRGWKFAGDK